MAIARNTRLLEDSEPLFRSTSRAAPPAVAAPVAAPAAAPVNLFSAIQPPALDLSQLANFIKASPTTPPITPAPAAPVTAAPTPLWSVGPNTDTFSPADLISLLKQPVTPAPKLEVSDAQYRGEPIIKADSGVDYAPYVPPPVAAPIAPPPAVVAPAPPPVAAPAAPAATPNIVDYLLSKQQQFVPQRIPGTSILSQERTQYDPTKDIAEYQRLYGAQANPWDIAYMSQSGAFARSQPGYEGPSFALSPVLAKLYKPKTIEELQEQFLTGQSRLTPEAFAALKESKRPAADYQTYLSEYNRKFEALPENLKQRAGLQGELLNQANQYGFKWDTPDVSGRQHTYNIAKLLEKSNVKSVGELEWRTVNGKDKLFNKTTGQPVDMYKDDEKNPKQLGWTAQGEGLVNYMVEKDAQGNPVIVPKWKSNAPGGVLGTALKLAPIALSFVNPALGAAASGISTAIQGGDIGDILKSAGTSYLGGQVGGYAGDLAKAATQGMAPGVSGALTGAATGAASSATTGALRGDLSLKNVATGALTGGAAGGISDLLSTYMPAKGTLYEQNVAPGSTPAPVSGSTFVDNVVRSAATQAPGTLIRGGDLGDILTNAAIGETVKTATGYIPKTDIDFVDRMIAGTAGQYLGKELRDVLGDTPSSRPPVVAQAPAPAPTTAPSPATQTPSAQDNSGLMAMLLAAGLMGDEGQDQTQAPPQLFQAPTLATLPGQLPGQLGGQPTSLAELMALLNTRRA